MPSSPVREMEKLPRSQVALGDALAREVALPSSNSLVPRQELGNEGKLCHPERSAKHAVEGSSAAGGKHWFQAGVRSYLPKCLPTAGPSFDCARRLAPLRITALCLLIVCGWFAAAALHAAPLQPDAGGVTLEVPEDGTIEVGTTLSVSFPSAMVATDKIDLGDQPSPVRFSPTLPGTWLWKSQTDGEFQVKKPVTPGQTYKAGLAPGLRDLDGKPVAPPGWGAELHTEAFTVDTDFDEDDQLPALPGIVLKFTAPVRSGRRGQAHLLPRPRQRRTPGGRDFPARGRPRRRTRGRRPARDPARPVARGPDVGPHRRGRTRAGRRHPVAISQERAAGHHRTVEDQVGQRVQPAPGQTADPRAFRR